MIFSFKSAQIFACGLQRNRKTLPCVCIPCFFRLMYKTKWKVYSLKDGIWKWISSTTLWHKLVFALFWRARQRQAFDQTSWNLTCCMKSAYLTHLRPPGGERTSLSPETRKSLAYLKEARCVAVPRSLSNRRHTEARRGVWKHFSCKKMSRWREVAHLPNVAVQNIWK